MKTLRFSTARLHKNNLRTSSFAIFIPPPLSPPSLLFVLSILMDLSSLCTYVLRDALLLRSVPFADCFKSVLRRIAKKRWQATNKQNAAHRSTTNCGALVPNTHFCATRVYYYCYGSPLVWRLLRSLLGWRSFGLRACCKLSWRCNFSALSNKTGGQINRQCRCAGHARVMAGDGCKD